MEKMPNLDALTVFDFEEMLEMSQNKRQKYYKFLFSTKSSQSNDEVLFSKSTKNS